MENNKPGNDVPLEKPNKEIPHKPSPTKDPDLSPNEENPINPKENLPDTNSTKDD
jgi:hypothetical protein